MPEDRRPVTFLLSQLGSLASSRFAERLQGNGLTPSEAGVLRLLGRNPGISQRALAQRLGTVPSRVVALIDVLESRGLVTRTRSAIDRRHQELSLTKAGIEQLRRIRPAAETHERDFLAGLTAVERSQLGDLLRKLAEAHALDPEIHPGYRPSPDKTKPADSESAASSDAHRAVAGTQIHVDSPGSRSGVANPLPAQVSAPVWKQTMTGPGGRSSRGDGPARPPADL